MDLNVEVNNHGQLTWYKQAATHTNFNKYSLFVLHAHARYREATSEERINIICSIPGLSDGDNDVDDLNYNTSMQSKMHGMEELCF